MFYFYDKITKQYFSIEGPKTVKMTKHKQQPMLKRGLQTGKYASEFELLFLIKMLQYCQWIKDNTNFKPNLD